LRNEPALYENQFSIYGFEWVDLNHRSESVVVYRRKGKNKEDDLLIILNLTPVVHNDWDVYVTGKAFSMEIFNSDAKKYWGTGDVYNPTIRCERSDDENETYKITVNLPPLAAIILK
jgi:1,4-alpha-glucan branching enzyme